MLALNMGVGEPEKVMGDADGSSELPSWFAADLRQARASAARGSAHFKPIVFMITLAEHVLHPFSWLWILPHKGVRPLINMVFIPSSEHNSIVRSYAILNLGFQFLFIAAHVAMWFSGRPHYSFLWPVILTTDIFVVMRFTVIAIKYGFMSRAERQLIQYGTFPESSALNQSMQVLSSYKLASLSVMVAELERLASQRHAFGLDMDRANIALTADGDSRVRARIEHDLRRLHLETISAAEPAVGTSLADVLQAALVGMAGEPALAGRCLVTSLVAATRLASQPSSVVKATNTQASRVVLFSPISIGFTMLVLLLPFSAPSHVDFVDSEGTARRRLIWLVPPYMCPCDFTCAAASHCFCSSADAADILLLLCLLIPLCITIRNVGDFIYVALLEAYRQQRSLTLWGQLLESDRFPTTHISSPSTETSSSSSSPRAAASSVSRARGASLDHMVASALGDDALEEEAEEAAADAAAEEADLNRPLCAQLNRHVLPPLIDATQPESVVGWYIGRLLLTAFGERFNSRVSAYMGFYLLELLVLLVSVLTYLMLSDFNAGINAQLVLATCYLVSFLAAPLGMQLMYLVQANWLHITHRHTLASANLGLRRKLAKLHLDGVDDGAHHAGLSAASRTLEQLMQQLEADQRAAPLRILFKLPATIEFISSIVAAAGVVAAFILSLTGDALQTQYNFYWSNMSAVPLNTSATAECALAPQPASRYELVHGVVLAVFAGCGFMLTLPLVLKLQCESYLRRCTPTRAAGVGRTTRGGSYDQGWIVRPATSNEHELTSSPRHASLSNPSALVPTSSVMVASSVKDVPTRKQSGKI